MPRKGIRLSYTFWNHLLIKYSWEYFQGFLWMKKTPRILEEKIERENEERKWERKNEEIKIRGCIFFNIICRFIFDEKFLKRKVSIKCSKLVERDFWSFATFFFSLSSSFTPPPSIIYREREKGKWRKWIRKKDWNVIYFPKKNHFRRLELWNVKKNWRKRERERERERKKEKEKEREERKRKREWRILNQRFSVTKYVERFQRKEKKETHFWRVVLTEGK